MKYAAFFSLALLYACSTSSIVNIPAGQAAEIAYTDMEMYDIALKNTTSEEIEVRIVSRNTGEKTGGFGLAPKGKTDVTIGGCCLLALVNDSDRDVRVKYSLEETERRAEPSADQAVSFTLRNSTAKSIPLIIPDVMNPNLSPFSNSGVYLKYGQEIFFKENGKKYILLVVDETIEEGEKIDVAELLKERRAELGLK